MSENLVIFDTTLRDGEQAPGFSMKIEEKIRLAKQLEALGVDIIEAGFPIASNDDAEAVRRVGQSVTRPVVAVRAENRAVGVRDAPDHHPEERPDLVRRRVADRIGQVHGRCAFLDDRFDDPAQKVHVTASRVLGRELDIVGVLARTTHRVDGQVEGRFAGHAELTGQVQVGGGDEGVNTSAAGRRD